MASIRSADRRNFDPLRIRESVNTSADWSSASASKIRHNSALCCSDPLPTAMPRDASNASMSKKRLEKIQNGLTGHNLSYLLGLSRER